MTEAYHPPPSLVAMRPDRRCDRISMHLFPIAEDTFPSSRYVLKTVASTLFAELIAYLWSLLPPVLLCSEQRKRAPLRTCLRVCFIPARPPPAYLKSRALTFDTTACGINLACTGISRDMKPRNDNFSEAGRTGSLQRRAHGRVTKEDIRSAGLRRWNGRSRITTDWFNLFHVYHL